MRVALKHQRVEAMKVIVEQYETDLEDNASEAPDYDR